EADVALLHQVVGEGWVARGAGEVGPERVRSPLVELRELLAVHGRLRYWGRVGDCDGRNCVFPVHPAVLLVLCWVRPVHCRADSSAAVAEGCGMRPSRALMRHVMIAEMINPRPGIRATVPKTSRASAMLGICVCRMRSPAPSSVSTMPNCSGPRTRDRPPGRRCSRSSAMGTGPASRKRRPDSVSMYWKSSWLLAKRSISLPWISLC